MNKKSWLDYLYYKIGKQQYDFYLCGLKKMPNGEVRATKWKKYSEVCFGINPWEDYKIEWVNQRQILPNELVLDVEEPDKFPEIIKKLKEWGESFKVYETGSRGYHIHLFFNKEVSKESKLFHIKMLGVDEQKAYTKTMIALENCPHWKTGKDKRKLSGEEIEADIEKFEEKTGFIKSKEKKEVVSSSSKEMKLKNYEEQKNG